MRKIFKLSLSLLASWLLAGSASAQVAVPPVELTPQQQLNASLNMGRPAVLLNDQLNRTSTVPRAPRLYRQATAPAGLTPLTVVGDGTTLWGCVISSQSIVPGAYNFQATKGSIGFDAMNTTITRPNGGGVFANGKLCLVNYTYYPAWGLLWGDVAIYDTETWAKDSKSRSVGSANAALIATDADYDPVSGKYYGCTYSNDLTGYQITQLDYDLAVPTQIALIDSVYVGVAFNAEGQMYGISGHGYLCKIDKANGQPTMVGFTGLKPGAYNQSAAFDRESGKLYWAAVDEEQHSALYEVNAATGAATKICDMPGNEQVTCLYVPASGQQAGAPSMAENLSAQFEGASYTGNVTFDIPSVTFNDAPLSGNVGYSILANGTEVKTGQAAAGSHVVESVTLEGGMTTIAVVLSNSVGTSPAARISLWVGYDAPNPVSSVKMEVEQETRTATVSWLPAKGSVHGGVLNEDEIVYNVVRYPDGVTVGTAVADTFFVDVIPGEGMAPFRYGVTPVNHGAAGVETLSSAIVVGTHVELPYVEDFATEAAYSMYKVIDANEDGYTFRYYQGNSYNAVQSPDSWRHESDDWLLTPPFHMTPDRTYRLTFRSRCYAGYNNKETMEVKIGQGEDYTTYNEILPRFDLPYNTPEFLIHTYEKVFRVDQEGNYRIGFHDVTEYDNDRFEIHSLSVTYGPLLSAPDTVTELKAVAGAKGATSATISFAAPAQTIAGNALNSLTKIEVSRGGEVIKTFDNPTPGQALQLTDEAAAEGDNTYSVLAYNEQGEGLEATVSVFVGYDVPLAPADVQLKDAADKPQLSWTAPTEGVNQGYVAPDELTYNIYTADQNGYAVPYKTGLTSTTFTADTTLNDPGLLIYAVDANSVKGRSELASSNVMVVGKPYTLPYRESFAGGTLGSFWWYDDMNCVMGVGDGSSDGDNGDLLWGSQNQNKGLSYGYWNTGRIALGENVLNPHLLFHYWNNGRSDTQITVNAIRPDQTTVQLHTIDMLHTYTNGWTLANVDLAPVANEKYVVLSFRFDGTDTENATGIDNVNVFDMYEYDLAAELTAPAKTVAGQNTAFSVKVTNWGSFNVSGYDVRLYDGNDVVATAHGSQLKSTAQRTHTLRYTPSITSADKLNIRAEVVYDNDLEPDNNLTETAVVQVLQPDMDPVANVGTSYVDGKSIQISWNAPKNDYRRVSDDFENYNAWTLNNFGEWTSVEGDGATHYAISGVTIPGNQSTTAYEVFSLSASGADTNVTQYSFLQPHSGDQFVVGMSGASGYYPKANVQHDDDWLISPELSGRAQTVSFFLKTMSSWKKESFEILYSTESADTASFQLLQSYTDEFTDWAWNEYTAELPEGTRFFAIRKVSFDKFGIMLDDFSFEKRRPTLTGYYIYRDGQLIGRTLANATSYIDPNGNGGPFVYGVTAVYDSGESSIVYASATTGITSVDNTETAPFDVYSADGKLLRRGVNSLHGLKSGVYVVNGKKVVR